MSVVLEFIPKKVRILLQRVCKRWYDRTLPLSFETLDCSQIMITEKLGPSKAEYPNFLSNENDNHSSLSKIQVLCDEKGS